MDSYRDWVVELSNTTGVSDYVLAGAPPGTSYFTFRQRYPDGNIETTFWVVNPDRTKWEKNRYSTLDFGPPDTLSRNVVESTNGDAPVSWVGGDTPLRVYVVADADAQEFAISMGFGTTKPDVLKYGLWADEDGVAADVDQINLWDGTNNIPVAKVNRNNHTVEWGNTPAGTVFNYAGATIPDGFLVCQGQAVSRTTYASLFTAIGTTYGVGNGTTTFNVPDAGGRSIYGKEASATRLTAAIAGINGNTLGTAGGDQRAQIHSHGVTDPSHAHSATGTGRVGQNLALGTNRAVGTADGTASGLFQELSVTVNANVTSVSIQNAFAGGSQNLPPAIVMNTMISTGGVT